MIRNAVLGLFGTLLIVLFLMVGITFGAWLDTRGLGSFIELRVFDGIVHITAGQLEFFLMGALLYIFVIAIPFWAGANPTRLPKSFRRRRFRVARWLRRKSYMTKREAR